MTASAGLVTSPSQSPANQTLFIAGRLTSREALMQATQPAQAATDKDMQSTEVAESSYGNPLDAESAMDSAQYCGCQSAGFYDQQKTETTNTLQGPKQSLYTQETDPAIRKSMPLVTGCVDYFPDALLAVAELSLYATQQHHQGSDMHWDRAKSGDEADAMGRHIQGRGTRDNDGVRHSVKLAWRALANLQKELEQELGLPVSRASR